MRVSMMVTCVVDQFRPEAAVAAERVLARAGHEINVPLDQTCCGQPAWNAGYTDEARRVARHTMRVFSGAERVVSLAGSCATMVRVFYRELFEGTRDAPAARSLAERTSEFSEFLGPSTAAASGSVAASVAYHDSCHMLRELGVRDQPRELLRGAGYTVHELSDRCCGFGGTFAIKLPEVSVAMADEKLGEFSATGARTLVGCDMSCLLHMGGRAARTGVSMRAAHLAEQLDEAGR